jgi:hypothetical protein
MILQLVAIEAQNLDSLFAKAVSFMPEWDNIHHLLVTAEDRKYTWRYEVPRRRTTIIRADEDKEEILVLSKNEPM